MVRIQREYKLHPIPWLSYNATPHVYDRKSVLNIIEHYYLATEKLIQIEINNNLMLSIFDYQALP